MLIINCLSSCILHFTLMSCSTLAGFSEALLGVKMLPATLPRTQQGEQKTILARLESKGNSRNTKKHNEYNAQYGYILPTSLAVLLLAPKGALYAIVCQYRSSRQGK